MLCVRAMRECHACLLLLLALRLLGQPRRLRAPLALLPLLLLLTLPLLLRPLVVETLRTDANTLCTNWLAARSCSTSSAFSRSNSPFSFWRFFCASNSVFRRVS